MPIGANVRALSYGGGRGNRPRGPEKLAVISSNFPLRPKLSICISLPRSEGHDHNDRKQDDHRDDEHEREPERHFLADYGRGRWRRGLGYWEALAAAVAGPA